MNAMYQAMRMLDSEKRAPWSLLCLSALLNKIENKPKTEQLKSKLIMQDCQHFSHQS